MTLRMTLRVALLGAAVCAAAVAGACANVTEPPGGPPDVKSPVVLKITPDSGVIATRIKEVVVQFDEVISETPRGAQNLAELVFISPKSGNVEVDWSRSKLSIKPSKGWRANTVYSVIINPGILDLRNNPVDSTISTVFSTGGPIPNTRLTGAAFDWAAGKHAPRALVEALFVDSTRKDTTFYQTLADSSGRFELRYLPAGPYLLRTVLDRNNNRGLEPLEPWDTTRVVVTQSARADLYAFVHDTVGLRISDLTLLDSGRTVKITFDKPYAPGPAMSTDRIRVLRPDSSALTVLRIVTPLERAREDSAKAAARADSAARAGRDTTAAGRLRADSIARRRTADSLAARDRAQREERRLAALRGGRPAPPRDTTPPPKFERPLVYTELFVLMQQPLPDSTRIRVLVRDLSSLSGTVRSPTREIVTPRPPRAPAPAPAPAPVRRDTLQPR
ncbi:MAG TPA: Ig-like domain-containing protein [Gemmatimonas sp.]|nr:Ig-like domain-containing protein [Gemmatimonas sp.]